MRLDAWSSRNRAHPAPTSVISVISSFLLLLLGRGGRHRLALALVLSARVLALVFLEALGAQIELGAVRASVQIRLGEAVGAANVARDARRWAELLAVVG